MFGMMTARILVEQFTRETSSPLAFGIINATFQVCAGTVTLPPAIVFTVPAPALPMPPVPAPPATMYISLAGRECSQIALQIGPWSLVVVRGLGNHVRHQECCLIDWSRSFLVSIRIRNHVPAIEAGADVIET